GMVWIHGGGFAIGGASLPIYDGAKLAAHGAGVVSIQYRLGPLGFLAHPALAAESETGTSGNFGFADIVAALEWVRDEIAGFGGDPGCVTVFGESAGAAAVARLLVTPSVCGLFHRAICQSGGATGSNRHLRRRWYGLDPMETVGEAVAAALGADPSDPLPAMRAVSTAEILKAADPAQGLYARGYKFGPVVDGDLLPDDPYDLLESAAVAPVPLLLGMNADEGTMFLKNVDVPDPASYDRFLDAAFAPFGDVFRAMFPVKTTDRIPAALNELITATAFASPMRLLARAAVRAGAPVYQYHFTRVPPGFRLRGFGAAHGLEIPYVFGTLFGKVTFDDADR
ncbi:MAG: carboxylesterase/lipase family protein, partial [Planctomycetia bacterium]